MCAKSVGVVATVGKEKSERSEEVEELYCGMCRMKEGQIFSVHAALAISKVGRGRGRGASS